MNRKTPVTDEEKNAQIKKEAKATFILFIICCLWHVGTGYLFNNSGIRLFGLPLWWLLSCPGVFVIAIVGLVYLLKNVFVDFDLGSEEEEDE
ncbi:MAG: YhdT family protein [Sphaerochaetaceae bacterium]|nr:YhdT family protein [Sphaerochaetaceae bacterium]